MKDIDLNELVVHECPFVGERQVSIVDAHWSIEKAYFTLLDRLTDLGSQPYITREELAAVLHNPAFEKPKPPLCDCGHEFSSDPKWWHLSNCAYRSFYLD